MMINKKPISEYSDTELDNMSYFTLAELAPTDVSVDMIRNRIARGWTRRRAASVQKLSQSHKPRADHPMKRFQSKFYSKSSQAKRKEIEDNWERNR